MELAVIYSLLGALAVIAVLILGAAKAGRVGGMFALVFSAWFAHKHRRLIYVVSSLAALPACCWAFAVAVFVW